MKNCAKKWLLSVLLAAIVPLVLACSAEGDADTSYMMNDASKNVTYSGIYEGEWTVNKQVVDTARLVVVNGMIKVRLPEMYLLNYIIPFGLPVDSVGRPVAEQAARYVPQNTTANILVSEQGYSEASQYMSFVPNMVQVDKSQLFYSTCSFYVSIDRLLFRISLLSRENATAVLQNATGQWTLGIPVDGFLITNFTTGEETVKNLSVRLTIYYSTRRRVG